MGLIYENILNEQKVADNGLLSKIQIGGKVHELKDLIAREKLSALRDAALQDVAENISGNGLVKASDVKSYVDAQVATINKFDVAIVDSLPAASEDTMYILYMVKNTSASSGEYIEYITIRSGTEGAYTYTMEQIGSTKMDITGFVSEEDLTQALTNYELKNNLKALAYKDSATGVIAAQTISGVKATGTTTGSIQVELQATEKAVASTGKFTPSGDVAVTLSGATFNTITNVGTQATFTEGTFTPASLVKEDVNLNYAKEGIVGSVEDETLIFTAAGIEALTATKITSFDGGSKQADTFVANSLPTMAERTVGVEAATFTGAESDVNVSGNCHEYSVKTSEFTGADIELAVGDIVIGEKNITVQ